MAQPSVCGGAVNGELQLRAHAGAGHRQEARRINAIAMG